MKRPIYGLLFLLCWLPLSAHASSSEEPDRLDYLYVSLGTGIEYESGDYGTDSTTELWRVPLIFEWAPTARFGLAMEIPFIRLEWTGETILIAGTPMPTGHGSGSGSGSMFGSDGEETMTTTVVNTKQSASGLGDMTLDSYLTLLPGTEQTPQINALLYAKFPTGDEKEGFGTGEFDWGVGLGLRQRFTDWSFYAEAMAIQPGTSADYDPDSYWDWLLSLSYRVSSSVRPGVSLSGGSAPFAGADDPLELKLKLSGLTGDHTSYSLYLSRGLSDASPDWGCGIFGYLDF